MTSPTWPKLAIVDRMFAACLRTASSSQATTRTLACPNVRYFCVAQARLFRTRSGRIMPDPKIVSKEDLPLSEAKWVTLKKIHWADPNGSQRVWESAERKTRGSSGIDAVAVLAILRSESNAFPPSTVIIEQYRPPVDAFVIELPAGLIDEGETPEQAAIRELEEETGYKAAKVIQTSPTVVADPGMTNANMQLVIVDVPFPGNLETYDQKLDAGEFITRRVVALDKLTEEFAAYAKKGFVVDAKLSHFAQGLELAKKLQQGQI